MGTPSDRRLRILHAAVRDADYPRARRVRESFEGHGDTPVTTRAEFGRTRIVNVLVTAARIFAARGPFDVVVLGEFSTQYAMVTLAKARLHRAVHVVDGFVGLFETVVEDRGEVPLQSLRARLIAGIDHIAVRAADVYLTDTAVRAEVVRRRLLRRTEVRWLPVGAPRWAKASGNPRTGGTLEVLYFGGLLPLHGFDTVIEALALCEESQVRLTAVGPLHADASVTAHIRRLGLQNRVAIVDPVPEAELALIIARHDVVLGVFGTSSKAATVIANKVWQGLACGRPVLTRSSDALMELSEIVGAQIKTVPPADPRALAEALQTVDWRSMSTDEPVHLELEHFVGDAFTAFRESLMTRVLGRRRVQ